MSRFFKDPDDTEESDSSSEESSSEDEKEKKTDAKFLSDSESDSEDDKRVVRSEKDKKFDEFHVEIKKLKDKMKINDWVSISSSFENLNKLFGKAKSLINKEGTPRFFMKAMLSIEALCEKQYADKDKKYNQSNTKALNSMRQKFRKWSKEFTPQIDAYKLNPLLTDDEEEEPKKKKKNKKVESSSEEESSEEEESESDDDDDSDESESDTEKKEKKGEDSSDDDEDYASGSDDDLDLDSKDMYNRSFWVKRADVGVSKKLTSKWENFTTASVNDNLQLFMKDLAKLLTEFSACGNSKIEDEKLHKMFSELSKNKRGKAIVDEIKASHTGEEELDFIIASRRVVTLLEKDAKDRKMDASEEAKLAGKKDDKIYTSDSIMKRLKELQAMRGKKGTDRKQVVEDLVLLAKKATAPVVLLKVQTTLMTALFDMTLNTMLFLPVETWKTAVTTLLGMVKVLNDNPDVRLSEDEEVKEAFDDEDEGFLNMEKLMESDVDREKRAEADRKRREEEQAAAGGPGVQFVEGNLYSFVQRCCAEFANSLQNIDPHQPEYVQRLMDEKMLLELVTASQAYYDKLEKILLQRNTALLRLELVYYHYRPTNDRLRISTTEDSAEDKNVFGLTRFLYKHGNDLEKTRSLLCHVYYLALHNRFDEARDLFLMSHVQDTINDADIRTRILFNRTMAQLGLSAFRLGRFDQALDSLTELYGSNHTKELLAQGIGMSKFTERDLEKERVEKRRQYPYHMHINLDVLESVHLLSAMFVEVPNTAMNGQERRKMISKVFRRYLDYHQGKAFNGPPENTRDCVMAATTKLQRGDWKKAMENIKRMKMWGLMPQSDKVFEQVQHKVQEVALRTYLLSYGPYYGSLSLTILCEMFELGEQEVYRLCSKMMVKEQLQGAWDQPSKCIFIYTGASNTLQRSALQYVDKAEMFLQQNEKLLEQKFGHQQGNRWGDGGGQANYYNNYNYRGGRNARSSYDLGSGRGI